MLPRRGARRNSTDPPHDQEAVVARRGARDLADQVTMRRRQAWEQELDEQAQTLHQGVLLFLDRRWHHQVIPMSSAKSARVAPSSERMNAGHTPLIYVENARREGKLAYVPKRPFTKPDLQRRSRMPKRPPTIERRRSVRRCKENSWKIKQKKREHY